MNSLESRRSHDAKESAEEQLEVQTMDVVRRVAGALASAEPDLFKLVVLSALQFRPTEMRRNFADTSIPTDVAILFNLVGDIAPVLDAEQRHQLQSYLSTSFLEMTGSMWETALEARS